MGESTEGSTAIDRLVHAMDELEQAFRELRFPPSPFLRILRESVEKAKEQVANGQHPEDL